MKWFIETFFGSVAEGFRNEGYRQAMNDLLVAKDKIYTQPLTLVGDGQRIENCFFLGAGLSVQSAGVEGAQWSTTPTP